MQKASSSNTYIKISPNHAFYTIPFKLLPSSTRIASPKMQHQQSPLNLCHHKPESFPLGEQIAYRHHREADQSLSQTPIEHVATKSQAHSKFPQLSLRSAAGNAGGCSRVPRRKELSKLYVKAGLLVGFFWVSLY